MTKQHIWRNIVVKKTSKVPGGLPAGVCGAAARRTRLLILKPCFRGRRSAELSATRWITIRSTGTDKPLPCGGADSPMLLSGLHAWDKQATCRRVINLNLIDPQSTPGVIKGVQHCMLGCSLLLVSHELLCFVLPVP